MLWFALSVGIIALGYGYIIVAGARGERTLQGKHTPP